MRGITASGLRVAIAVAAALAIVFVVFGGLVHGYSPRSLLLLSLSGAFIGAIAAPEFEPKAFRHPTLWQVAFSVLGFVAGAVYLGAGTEELALAVALGVLIGYLAPYWLKLFQVP